MRLTLILLLALLAQSTEPPEYKAGQFCTPKGDMVAGRQTTDHPCACKRHEQADDKTMCKAGEAQDASHDAVCKQYCHEGHCMCPISCDTKGHAR